MGRKWIALAGALMIAGTPAHADVKAGVDAWSRGDYERAIAEWRPLADAGNADAQFNLGQAYKLGRGVAADLPTATEWFRKAALQGHAQAGDSLGLALYQAGDKAAALPWLEKSAARDEKRSELVLGTMLFNGEAGAKDWPRAYALVTRAAQQGVSQADGAKKQMETYIPAEQRQRGLAMAQQMAARGQVAGAGSTAIAASATLPVPVRRPASAPATPAAPAQTTATPRPAPAPAVAAPAPASGGWAVQLGAFRDAGNAHDLWARKGGAVGGSPAYVKAGALTRLLATGFATKAEAQRACARAGGGCIVTTR